MALCGLGLMAAYLVPSHYPPWLSFHGNALAALAFVPITAWAVARRNPVFPLPAQLFGVVALIPLAQWGLGQIVYAGDAWMASLHLLGAACAVCAGATCARLAPMAASTRFRGQDALAPMAAALVLATIVSFGCAVHQWLGLGLLGVLIEPLAPNGRPYANLAQPNHLATLALMGAASTAYLFEARRIGGVTAGAAAGICLFVAAMTQSRTVPLALLFVAVLAWRYRRVAFGRLRAAHLALATSFHATVVTCWQAIQHLLLIPSAPGILDRTTDSLRLALWSLELDAISRAPWTGYGWNQAGFGQWAVALDHDSVRYFFDSAHNIILDLLLWNGIPIGILIIGAALYIMIKMIAKIDHPKYFWAFILILIIGCHGMVEYPLSYAYFLLPACYATGVLWAIPRAGVPSFEPRKLSLQSLWVPQSVAVAAGTLLTITLIEYPRWETAWAQLRYEKNRIGPTSHAPKTPPAILLTNLRDLTIFSRMNVDKNISNDTLKWMFDVTRRYPYPASIHKYAIALQLNGYAELANQQIARMCKMTSHLKCRQVMSDWAAH